MTRSPSVNTKTTSPTSSPSSVILWTILDTTWRMFVPTLGGLSIGYIIDNIAETGLIFTLAFVFVGALISGILIYLQLKDNQK